MKMLYIKPEIEVVVPMEELMEMPKQSNGYIDAKEQTFENEETFFNRDTKNIWETEEEEE